MMGFLPPVIAVGRVRGQLLARLKGKRTTCCKCRPLQPPRLAHALPLATPLQMPLFSWSELDELVEELELCGCASAPAVNKTNKQNQENKTFARRFFITAERRGFTAVVWVRIVATERAERALDVWRHNLPLLLEVLTCHGTTCF